MVLSSGESVFLEHSFIFFPNTFGGNAQMLFSNGEVIGFTLILCHPFFFFFFFFFVQTFFMPSFSSCEKAAYRSETWPTREKVSLQNIPIPRTCDCDFEHSLFVIKKCLPSTLNLLKKNLLLYCTQKYYVCGQVFCFLCSRSFSTRKGKPGS